MKRKGLFSFGFFRIRYDKVEVVAQVHLTRMYNYEGEYELYSAQSYDVCGSPVDQ